MPSFKTAFESLGFQLHPGANSGKLLGYTEFTFTIDPQAATRSSSEASFLQEGIQTSTLQVYQQTLANKILFDSNKKATGVSVTTAGKDYILSARNEVILSAGAVSPSKVFRGLAVYTRLIFSSFDPLKCSWYPA